MTGRARGHLVGRRAVAPGRADSGRADGRAAVGAGVAGRFLATGIYGHQFANAGEILRNYPGWRPADRAGFGELMLRAFHAANHVFLVCHNGAKND